MGKFQVKATINQPREVVFRNFIVLAKQSFNKFDEKNPLGAKSKRAVKRTKSGTVYMETEVTGYRENELYESSGLMLSSKYKSIYQFNKIDNKTTEIILTEEQNLYGLLNKIGYAFQVLTAKKKIQKKLNHSIDLIEEQIEKEIRKKENKKNKQ